MSSKVVPLPSRESWTVKPIASHNQSAHPSSAPSWEDRMTKMESQMDYVVKMLENLTAANVNGSFGSSEVSFDRMSNSSSASRGGRTAPSPMRRRPSTTKRLASGYLDVLLQQEKAREEEAANKRRLSSYNLKRAGSTRTKLTASASLLTKLGIDKSHSAKEQSTSQAATGAEPTATFHPGKKRASITTVVGLKRKVRKWHRKFDLGITKTVSDAVLSTVHTLTGTPHHRHHEQRRVLMDYHPLMIDPVGSFRMLWDMGIVTPLLLYLTVVLPFRLCFSNEAVLRSPWFWFEFGIEMVFCFDILLNFRTGFFLEGIGDEPIGSLTIEYHPFSVARHYMRSWFLLDVFSGIPFGLLDLLASSSSSSVNEDAFAFKMMKSLRLLRFIKLTRLLKLNEMASSVDRNTLDRIEDFFHEGRTRAVLLLASLALQLGFICHISACLFVMVGRQGSVNNLDNWLEHQFYGPFEASDTTGGPKVGSIYLAAFYFCLTTMTSVGYGDMVTYNNTERVFCIFLEFVGGFVFAMIIASLTSVVTSSDMNARKTAEQLDAVSSFVVNRQFPPTLGRRIRRHFRQFYVHKSAIDERKIFGEMSSALRRDVSAYIVSVRMSDVKLFQTMNAKLWPRLFPLLNPTHFEFGELMCTQDDECTEMYIILEGSLHGKTVISRPASAEGCSGLSSRVISEGSNEDYADSWEHTLSRGRNGEHTGEGAARAAAPASGGQRRVLSPFDVDSSSEGGVGSGGGSGQPPVSPLGSSTPVTPTSKTDLLQSRRSSKGGGGSGSFRGSGNNSSRLAGFASSFRVKSTGSDEGRRQVKREPSAMGLDEDLDDEEGGNLNEDDMESSTNDARSGVKHRNIGSGDSVNVLCVLKVWDRCVESVVCETNVESYAVNADEFYLLFNHDNEIDQITFDEMRRQETNNFRMDTAQDAPTAFGVPLYMTFSCVSVTVVAARNIIAADTNIIGKGTSDPYVVVDLVDFATGRNVNSQWYHKTSTKYKTLAPRWRDKNSVRWRDVHLPFELLALRIRLFDEDMLDEDDELGEVYIRASDLEIDREGCPFVRFREPSTPSGKSSNFTSTRVNGGRRSMVELQTLSERSGSNLASPSSEDVGGSGGSSRNMDRLSSGSSSSSFDSSVSVGSHRRWLVLRDAIKSMTRGGPGGVGGRDPSMPWIDDTEFNEQLKAESNNILDMWHELQPTARMKAVAEKSGRPLPESCGQIRLRTWIKRSEASTSEVVAPPPPTPLSERRENASAFRGGGGGGGFYGSGIEAEVWRAPGSLRKTNSRSAPNLKVDEVQEEEEEEEAKAEKSAVTGGDKMSRVVEQSIILPGRAPHEPPQEPPGPALRTRGTDDSVTGGRDGSVEPGAAQQQEGSRFETATSSNFGQGSPLLQVQSVLSVSLSEEEGPGDVSSVGAGSPSRPRKPPLENGYFNGPSDASVSEL